MAMREYAPETQEEAAHLQEMADLFAAGFSVEELRAKRVPGHPLVLGSVPAETVTVRLLPGTVTRLDEYARRKNKSRSDYIRQALDREMEEDEQQLATA